MKAKLLDCLKRLSAAETRLDKLSDAEFKDDNNETAGSLLIELEDIANEILQIVGYVDNEDPS